MEWPNGLGAKGNEGVSNNVSQTKGSIGYVEYAYALQNKLVYTKLVNKDGKTIGPTSAAFQAAAANADWNSVPGYGVILANQSGAESWPMTAATFILIQKQPQDPAAAAEALKFFAWAYAQGRPDGRRARLRADAEESRRRGRESLGQRDKGLERQAAARRQRHVAIVRK